MAHSKAYQETFKRYRDVIIPEVGLDRIKEVYRDAVFMENVEERRQALLAAIEWHENNDARPVD